MKIVPLKNHPIYGFLKKALEKDSPIDLLSGKGACKISVFRENGCIVLQILAEYEDKKFFFFEKEGVVGFTDARNQNKEDSFNGKDAMVRVDALMSILNKHMGD